MPADMKSRGPSHEVLYWRVALGVIGLLAPALIRAVAPRFPWQPLCFVLPLIGFIAGGAFASRRSRRLQDVRKAREREVWRTVWTDHPDCRRPSESRDTSDR